MRFLDRLLQDWRISKTIPYLRSGFRILDVGCADGKLFRSLPFDLETGIGIDSRLEKNQDCGTYVLIRGTFPEDVPKSAPFDIITMLAVFEHIPKGKQAALSRACFELLRSGGKVILTIPSPQVDLILDFLKMIRLADGMEDHQHYGYKVSETAAIFSSQGFQLVSQKTFQLGLNHLFVFEKPLVLPP